MAEVEKEYWDPGFFGTTNYWKHPWGATYTDSVKYFMETKGAYWTMDILVSYLLELQKYDFLVITFDVEGEECLFSVREDSGEPTVIEQRIPFTDLDVSVKLFWEGGVILFPSDH